MRIIKNFTVIIMCVFMFSCGDDDTNTSSIETTDVSLNILDNVISGDVIGDVLGETSTGDITYSVKSQIPNDAIAIDSETGALSIANASLIDASIHPEIFAVVTVSNGSVTKTSNVTVKVDFAITIETEDVIKDIPDPTVAIENGDVMGVVTASTNTGVVAYRIIEEYPLGALTVDESTGEITVASADFFNSGDPLTTITAIVEVSNGNATAYAQVIVKVIVPVIVIAPSIFDWESNASRTSFGEVIHTKDGITVTATIPRLQLVLDNIISGYYDTTYPGTGWEAMEETVFYTKDGLGDFQGTPDDLTFTFSQPVTLNKFYAGNVNESPISSYRVTFSTTDGVGNSDVVIVYDNITIHEVVLNWTEVTSFTVKSELISGATVRCKLAFDGMLINDKID